jgi:hypothetical protein
MTFLKIMSSHLEALCATPTHIHLHTITASQMEAIGRTKLIEHKPFQSKTIFPLFIL